jgi:hypothetical protein
VESDAIAGLRSEKPALYAKHEGREYVTTVYNGQSGQQVYRKGDAEQDFVLSSSKASNQTQFCFTLDEDFLGKHEVHIESLQARIEKLEQVFESRLSISCIYTLV